MKLKMISGKSKFTFFFSTSKNWLRDSFFSFVSLSKLHVSFPLLPFCSSAERKASLKQEIDIFFSSLCSLLSLFTLWYCLFHPLLPRVTWKVCFYFGLPFGVSPLIKLPFLNTHSLLHSFYTFLHCMHCSLVNQNLVIFSSVLLMQE